MCNGIKSAKQYDVQKTVITVKQLIQLLVLETIKLKLEIRYHRNTS